MINIQDLHFKKEILPLFDFTQNELTRITLIELLSRPPSSVEDILLIQNTIKGFLQNKQLFQTFTYSKSEFNEVYQLFEYLKNGNAEANDSLAVRLIFFRKEKQVIAGRLSQCIFFLYKINSFYFSSLTTTVFTASFETRLKNAIQFIESLDISKYQDIVRRKRLKILHISSLLDIISKKIRSGEADIFWQSLFLFEAWLSVAKGIRKHDFTFPIFSETSFSLTAFYHPLLKEPVKNDVDIKDNVILITGPNMSGKSTLLKAICLCVYLGHLGLAVPAAGCVLPFFNSISVAINLNDDIKNGYSHFMTEIKTLKNIVTEAAGSKKCFAVFDELFRGTNVDDALAISKTTIEGLTKFTGSCFIISTHLHQLKNVIDLNENKTGSYYIECNLDEDKPIFTYQLKKGWSDLKIGQILFEQEGLNKLFGIR